MTPARLKLVTVLWILSAAGLLMLSWTQEWLVVRANATEIPVGGDAAAPSLAALALAGLALAGAVVIASPVFRIVLGVLQTALGATALLQCALTISNPVAAASGAITTATGVEGADSLAAAVDSVTSSAWPWLALAASTAAAIGGIAVIAGARRWPQPTRKYQVARFEDARGASASADDWDALGEGDDPTSR